MLYDFLTRERATILGRARTSALALHKTTPTPVQLEEGWNYFYSELIGLLELDRPFEFNSEKGVHTEAAEKHGATYHRMGFSVSEVVYSYGVICQAITATASDLSYPITSREFQRLNLSLDTAIAEAVTAFDRLRRDQDLSENRRIGKLARDLRGSVEDVNLTMEMIQSGTVGLRSNTASVMNRSLRRITTLIDTQLTDIRLRTDPENQLEKVRAMKVLSEVGVTATAHARSKNINLVMQGSPELQIEVDVQLLVSALSNLVENAVKYSRPHATVSVRVHELGGRVLIEVEDECGGISEDAMQELLSTNGSIQEGSSSNGIGGLTVTRESVRRMNGELRSENITGKACIFVIELPAMVVATP